jgi:hypothetical protein
MPTRKKPVHVEKAGVEDVLQGAAKAIGSALGTFARKTGMVHAAPEPPKASAKAVKKVKKRAPRKKTKQARKRP